MLSYFFSVFAFRGETNIASGELDNGGSILCCIGWWTVFLYVCVCVCGSEVDLVIREDYYPFCSEYATKGDMSQRRKSRELSGH